MALTADRYPVATLAELPDDIRNTYGDVDVVVDPTSAQLLQGATLDYKDGLEAGFAITNPSAQSSCGCGQSFS